MMTDDVDLFEGFQTPDEILALVARMAGMATPTELLDALLEGKIIDCDGLNNAADKLEGAGLDDDAGAVRDAAGRADDHVPLEIADILNDPNRANIKGALGKLYREGKLDLATLAPADHDLLNYLYRLRGKSAREYLRERRLEHLSGER
ncbi:MAG: hypothetical protein JOY90_19140 [Bradyrhizobium sp.]|nr:hypothetical protein [Bradyrhizobium sp.]